MGRFAWHDRERMVFGPCAAFLSAILFAFSQCPKGNANAVFRGVFFVFCWFGAFSKRSYFQKLLCHQGPLVKNILRLVAVCSLLVG
jgi:hypothetical protein